MKDFVSRQWNRVVTFLATFVDFGASNRSIWQVIQDVEAERAPAMAVPPRSSRWSRGEAAR